MMHHAKKAWIQRRGFKDSPGFLNSTVHWGPKEGRNATSPLHSRGSPKKGTKLKVKTYARGHHDAPRDKVWIQRLSPFPE